MAWEKNEPAGWVETQPASDAIEDRKKKRDTKPEMLPIRKLDDVLYTDEEKVKRVKLKDELDSLESTVTPAQAGDEDLSDLFDTPAEKKKRTRSQAIVDKKAEQSAAQLLAKSIHIPKRAKPEEHETDTMDNDGFSQWLLNN